MGKKRRVTYPSPWRKVGEEVSDKIEISVLRHGDLRIQTFKEIEYSRKLNRWDRDRRTETVRGPELSDIERVLNLSDNQHTHLALLRGGIDVIYRLVNRYKGWLWRKEQRETERRKKEYAKKKVEWAAKRHHKENLSRRAENKFCRRIDL